MAKINVIEKEKSKGDEFDGYSTEFNGKTFESKLYGGDTRTKQQKADAHWEYLLSVVIEDAVKRGLPEPEKVK